MSSGEGPRASQLRGGVEHVDDDLVARDEVDVYSILIRSSEIWLKNQERWRSENPETVIQEILDRIPNAPPTHARSTFPESKELLQPSELEAFFLFKVMDSGSKAFELTPETPSSISFPIAESIRCLRDGLRTKRFVSAIDQGIKELENDGKPIHVLDAGAGAIPILSIAAAFASPHTECTSLETNPHSLAFAQAVVRSLGLEKQITLINADATSYTPEKPIDLLVSETMDTGLLNEPLTEIMGNLAQHVRSGGLVLPNKVEVVATSIPREAYANSQELVYIYGNPSPKIEASWQTTGEYIPGSQFKEIKGDLPGSEYAGQERVVLIASRVVLGRQELGLYDSLISMPQAKGTFKEGTFIPDVFTSSAGSSIHVAYVPGARIADVRVSVR